MKAHRTLALSLLASCLLVGAAHAADIHKIIIDFEDDVAGEKPNGFSSVDSDRVMFYDTVGENLTLFNFTPQSNGNGLAARSDDASALEIRLAAPTNRISLLFGNDDPIRCDPADLAVFDLFRDQERVARTSVSVNCDDIGNQRIALGGVRIFDRAVFQYQNPDGTPLDLIELVDEIIISPLCSVAAMPRSTGETLTGTADPDVICGGDGPDIIAGLAGRDILFGGAGNDRILGGPDRDRLDGGLGRDELFGDDGRDLLDGNVGRDRLDGGPGNDICDGGPSGGTRGDILVSCERTSRSVAASRASASSLD